MLNPVARTRTALPRLPRIPANSSFSSVPSTVGSLPCCVTRSRPRHDCEPWVQFLEVGWKKILIFFFNGIEWLLPIHKLGYRIGKLLALHWFGDILTYNPHEIANFESIAYLCHHLMLNKRISSEQCGGEHVDCCLHKWGQLQCHPEGPCLYLHGSLVTRIVKTPWCYTKPMLK